MRLNIVFSDVTNASDVVHSSLSPWWFLVNGNRRNDIQATIPALERWKWTVDAVLQCRLGQGHANKLAIIQCGGHITSYSARSSLRTCLFYPLVPRAHRCLSTKSCTNWNVKLWQTSFPVTNNSVQFELNQSVDIAPFHVDKADLSLAFMFPVWLGALHWLSKA